MPRGTPYPQGVKNVLQCYISLTMGLFSRFLYYILYYEMQQECYRLQSRLMVEKGRAPEVRKNPTAKVAKISPINDQPTFTPEFNDEFRGSECVCPFCD
jgi:hypothetical protein